jgi:hypothetical protein
LSQFFATNAGGPVEYAGRQLWPKYRVAVEPGDRLHMFFERFRREPLQGLAVECANRRHKVEVGGQALNGFTLWTDTAPKHVELTFLGKRAAGEVVLMNVWRLPEYEQVRFAGVNAAAMAVTEVSPNEWRLECSDGYGLETPRFDDLVVRVIREPSHVQGATI